MVKLVKKKIKNTKDVDIVVHDAFGQEYQLFPNEEKRLVVLEKEKKDDRR